jgi:hypothetical protein
MGQPKSLTEFLEMADANYPHLNRLTCFQMALSDAKQGSMSVAHLFMSEQDILRTVASGFYEALLDHEAQLAASPVTDEEVLRIAQGLHHSQWVRIVYATIVADSYRDWVDAPLIRKGLLLKTETPDIIYLYVTDLGRRVLAWKDLLQDAP